MVHVIPRTEAQYVYVDESTLDEVLDEIDARLVGTMHYKGSVDVKEDLPDEGNTVGDYYNVIATNENWAWNGTSWDLAGSVLNMESISNSEILDILNS